MAMGVAPRKEQAKLPEHLRRRPKNDPERMRFEKDWKTGVIALLATKQPATPFFQKPKRPLFYLSLALFGGLCMVGSAGLRYYIKTAKELRYQIGETMATKGYPQNDPVVAAQFAEMENIVLLSKLRDMLGFARTLPSKGLHNDGDLAPLDSYMAYIEANHLPFNTREAIKWLVKTYR